ncbi:MAG: oligosaccharide flippase family protein, partial [Symploca sp. SIO3E6]|nr:oligosaccharide flippase family protein [Caldora sp. SIO3E6]
MKNLQSRLAKTVAGTSGLKLANIGLSFVVSVLLSRLLGAQGYGNYAYAMSWVFVLLIPATMGFKGLIVREIAINQSHQAWGLIRGILRWSNLIVLFTSFGIALLAAAVAWGLRGEASWETLLTFWVALILLPIRAFTTLRLSAMRGLHHIVLGQLPEQL